MPSVEFVHFKRMPSAGHLVAGLVYGVRLAQAEQFAGFRRLDGRVGIRNQVLVVPTVGCINNVCEEVARIARERSGYSEIYAMPHPYGCSQLGEDHADFRKLLVSVSQNPNAAGVLFVGLGCENNGIGGIREQLKGLPSEHVCFINCQDEEDEVIAGKEKVKELIVRYAAKREKTELGELAIGLKCGGSDGFSGITANPLVGKISDRLVSYGASAVLTEVPEMFGAETILMNRCKNEELFEKTVSMVNNFKEYFLSHGEPVGENPSPGNKAGGISTLEDKALGCTQKCGRAPVSGVLEYGDRLSESGLNLLSAPGNDLVAATALASAGCQIVLFTTGRGTPFGTFVPTMKIATNPTLAARKPNWIDFNAGQLVEGRPMKELVRDFIGKVLAVASGEKARNEANGYREIAIFKNGVTL